MKGIRKGDTVCMTEAHKRELIANGSAEHVAEFGDHYGIVECFLDYHNNGEELSLEKIGPEVDVRYANGLRYGYHPDHLRRMGEPEPEGGTDALGSAAATVDERAGLSMNNTTPGPTITIPWPTEGSGGSE